MKFGDFYQTLKDGLIGIKKTFFISTYKKYGYFAKNAKIFQPGFCIKENVFIYENSVVHEFHKLITLKGKFVLKQNSVAAAGLTVITCNHGYKNVGDYPNGQGWTDYIIEDVIVEEHVWIGANVTLCPGSHVNRGIIVAAGAVCTKTYYPPYSIIGGNPAKFIKFKFTLDEQIEHEIKCFDEKDRLDRQLLIDNYKKFNK